MAETTRASPAPDAVVIGGGVIGCSIALRLAQARLRVVVVDRGEPGAEASSAAAGMLAPQGENTILNDFFRLCLASRDLYPSFIAEVEDLSGERLGYRQDGTLLVAISEEECRALEAVEDAQSRAALPLERLSGEAARKRVPGLSPEVRLGLQVPGDHWLDNERLCRALATASRRVGVEFKTGSAVTKFNVRNAHVESVELTAVAVGEKPQASGPRSTLAAGQFVLAAGCWSEPLAASLGLSAGLRPCRGQMMEFDLPAELPLVVRLGHHYLVPRAPQRVLAGTTAEYVGYDKAVTARGLQSILEGTSRLFPGLGDFRFRRAWAGLRPDTPDHLPLLGYGAFENLIFSTGHFRSGILLAPLTAQLVTELFLTRATSHPLDAYDPGRFARRASAP